jgi:hypothetical protein
MEKFDKSKAWDDISKLFSELGSIKDPIQQGMAYLTQIPNFLESIWRRGYLDGIEEGKRQKVNELSKKN